MQDEQLREVLKKWEAPQPSAALDRRVFGACKPVKAISWKLWGAVAAGVALMVAANFLSPSRPVVRGEPRQLETRLTATGFRPMPEGAVTVMKAGAKQ
jgi:hypothetical protein